MTYTFSLRQDIRFHDGTDFNATAVQMNFWRMLGRGWDDGYGPVWMIAEPILGGQAVEDAVYTYGDGSAEHIAAWNNWIDNVDAVVVVNDYELQIHLAYAYTPFIAALTHSVGSIISPTFFMVHGGMAPDGSDTTLDQEMCGTGPYMMTHWIPDDRIVLSLNENYWRESSSTGAGSIETVVIKSNYYVNSRILNLQAGTSDGCAWPKYYASEIYDSLSLESKNPEIFVSTGSYTFDLIFAGFNLGEVKVLDDYYTSPFSNLHFRNAVILAFDYDAFIQESLGGFGVQAEGPIPRGMFGHDGTYFEVVQDIDDAVYEWNLAMTDSGFVQSLNLLNNTLTFYYKVTSYPMDPFYDLLAIALESIWDHADANMTGLDSSMSYEFYGVEWSAGWMDYIGENRLLVQLSGWTPDFADPDDYLFPLVYRNGIFAQRIGYNNSLVNALYESQKGESDSTTRLDILSLLQYYVAEDNPYLWLGQETEFRVWRAWLYGDGLVFNPMHDIYFYNVYKTEAQGTNYLDTVITYVLIAGISIELVIIGTLLVLRFRRRRD